VIRDLRFALRRINDDIGFAPPSTRQLGRERRSVACVPWLAGIGLAAGTLIAATAGIARADGLVPIAGQHTSLFAVVGLLFAGMGGLTVMSLAPSSRRSLGD
jgi:hypothetical protein